MNSQFRTDQELAERAHYLYAVKGKSRNEIQGILISEGVDIQRASKIADQADEQSLLLAMSERDKGRRGILIGLSLIGVGAAVSLVAQVIELTVKVQVAALLGAVIGCVMVGAGLVRRAQAKKIRRKRR
jgi:hypothetical protein